MSYSARLTLAVPVDLIQQANQLALLIGESPADVGTFTAARYTIDDVPYAVASTACVPRVIAYLTEGLPSDPESGDVLNPNDADLAQAGEAFVAIQQGLIKVSMATDPSVAMSELNLEVIAEPTFQEGSTEDDPVEGL